MKNLHKVALSIMVGVLAIAFSAFKTAEYNVAPFGNKQLKAGAITSDYLQQNQPTAGVFGQGTTFDSNNCGQTAATLRCSYTVSAAGKANIPNQSTYTSAEIGTYLTNNWVAATPQSSNSRYED